MRFKHSLAYGILNIEYNKIDHFILQHIQHFRKITPPIFENHRDVFATSGTFHKKYHLNLRCDCGRNK